MKGHRVLLLVVASVILGGAAYLFLRSTNGGIRDHSGKIAQQTTPAPTPVLSATPSRDNATRSAEPGNLIDNAFKDLRSGKFSSQDLDRLRKELLAMNPDQAAAFIREFLLTGQDAPTDQEFALGEGGTLAGAPTFRTFLLDLLGQVSRKTRNPAAVAISKQILEQKKSADEWAVAMRNVAWMEPQSKPYLATKMREMLSHEPWKTAPSAGMLEAFDVIVFSGDPAFIPDLANLLSTGDDALRRASAVALDRLSEMAPLEVMNRLNANPTELNDKPFLRADYFAKADLRNPAQLTALELYLSRTDVTVAEKGKLLKGLVTPASFVSENLITQAPPPDDGVARQQQLMQIMSQWQAQNRFPPLRGEIAKVQQRLAR